MSRLNYYTISSCIFPSQRCEHVRYADRKLAIYRGTLQYQGFTQQNDQQSDEPITRLCY